VAAVPPDGAHEYVYDGVPPEADTVADPFVPPLHVMFVCADGLAVSAGGCVMLNVCVAVQLFASVTVTV
jgi:hypothetical protein